MENKICEICATQFKKKTKFCSKKCALEYTARLKRVERNKFVCNNCNKGFEDIRNNCKYCSQKCYLSHNDTSKYLVNWAKNSGEYISKKAKERYKDKTKHPWFKRQHSKETKEKISKHHTETGCLLGSKNGMFGRKHSKKSRELMSETQTKNWIESGRILSKTGHLKGKFHSKKMNTEIFYRSSWEKFYYEYLENSVDVVEFQVEKLRISYLDTNLHKRNYIPDVFVLYRDRKELIEIKPKYFQQSESNRLKFDAARKYCNLNQIHFKIIQKEDLEFLGMKI